MHLSPYDQLFCNECGVPVGSSGQSPAYASETGVWKCAKDIEPEFRKKVERGRVNPNTGKIRGGVV